MAYLFRRIGLMAKPDPVVAPTLQQLIDLLEQLGTKVSLETTAASQLPDYSGTPLSAETLAPEIDLMITVGGDGTLLKASRLLADHDIPLLGINLGRLGFLADILPSNMAQQLDTILQGAFDEERRFLLRTEIVRDGQVINSRLALNDAVIHKWNTARLIEFETYVNGCFVDFQRSDGLIISTPTGSTAYALSGGGPLMEPDLNALVLVPICPHTLSNRPIVVGGDKCIELAVCGNTDPANVRVSCDGQADLEISHGDRVRIRRHPGTVRLIHPQGHDHFDILREKLGWAEHQGNN